MKRLISSLLFVAAGAVAAGTYPTVMAEPNLEKRSELALKEADGRITAAKKAYDENDMKEFSAHLSETQELVELSYKSLVDTGKRARKSPKYFKRAEQNIRTLIRRLDSLAADVGLEDREKVTTARNEINEVHDDLVHDIMTKK